MNRISTQESFQSEIALKTLRWVLYAYRWPTIDELKHALAIRPGDSDLDREGIPEESDIISSCQGLVVLNENTGMVSTLHLTFDDYALDGRWPDLKSSACHRETAELCLTYLLFESIADEGGEPVDCTYDSDDPDKLVGVYETPERSYEDYIMESKDFPLLDYASKYWGDHARQHLDAQHLDITLKYMEKPRESFRVKISSDFGYYFNHGGHAFGRIIGSQVEPLCLAASYGLMNAVSSIIRSPSNYLAYSGAKERAFHLAIINQELLVARMLLDDGVDVDAMDDLNQSALHNAADGGLMSSVKFLLENSASVNTPLAFYTPLQGAVTGNNVDITEILIHAGADIDFTDPISGWTAAHYATRISDVEIVDLLMQWNADSTIKTNKGKTPHQIAVETGKTEKAKLIEEYLRRQNIQLSENTEGDEHGPLIPSNGSQPHTDAEERERDTKFTTFEASHQNVKPKSTDSNDAPAITHANDPRVSVTGTEQQHCTEPVESASGSPYPIALNHRPGLSLIEADHHLDDAGEDDCQADFERHSEDHASTPSDAAGPEVDAKAAKPPPVTVPLGRS